MYSESCVCNITTLKKFRDSDIQNTMKKNIFRYFIQNFNDIIGNPYGFLENKKTMGSTLWFSRKLKKTKKRRKFENSPKKIQNGKSRTPH